MKRAVAVFIGVVALFLVVMWLMFLTNYSTIEEEVTSRGYELLDVQYNSDFEPDPFPWYEHGKGVNIFHFTYLDNGVVREGWVKFGLTTRWIWEEKQ